MKQQLTLLTLGVDNLDQMRAFYNDKFGWTPMVDRDGIVFYKVNGSILSLYPKEELAEDIGIQDNGNGFKRITLAITFGSEEEVNAAFTELKSKGVVVVKEPSKAFWGGYSGYVSDAEGNYWELAHNPFLATDKNGFVI